MRKPAIAGLVFVLLACAKPSPPQPPDGGPDPYPARSCETLLVVRPAQSVARIEVAGEWTGFNTSSQPLARQADGSFSISLQLAPGEYAYKLVVGGQFALDTANPFTKYFNGIVNSDLRVPDCQLPLLTLQSFQASGATADATLSLTDGASASGIDTVSATLDGQALLVALAPPLITVHASGLAAGKHVIQVDARDRAGHAAKGLYLPLWVEATPFEWKDALLYFAMIDRFENGDPSNDHPVPGAVLAGNFQGGDLAGLKARIDSGWFDALGVRALWISNPAQQPLGSWPGSYGRATGYHGYWSVSPTQVDSRWGTEAELRATVDAAHAHGMRVLLDFVANHVHQDHPWFTQSGQTAYFNPLNVNGGQCVCGSQTCPNFDLVCWFTPYLPDINYRDQEAVIGMENLALDWMKRFGFDGLRVDAVKQFDHIAGLTLRARLHEELEATGVPTYLVGEAFDNAEVIKQYVSPIEMHGCFDFPLMYAIQNALTSDAGSFRGVESILSTNAATYGAEAVMSPFFGNHDLPRFTSLAAGQDVSNPIGNPPAQPSDAVTYQRVRLALALLLTLPGAPLLYYGDEIAMPGANDPDNRRLMRFDNLDANEMAVLARARTLGTLRKADLPLRRGAYQTLFVDDLVLVYARHLTGMPARVIALNRDPNPQQRSVQLPAGLELPDGTQLSDALSTATLAPAGGKLALSLPGRSAAVYLPH